MAILWQSSLVPFIDPNGDPYSGAQAFFYNADTTTPLTVYKDSGLGISHGFPVVANASGMFPAVFLPSVQYRMRIETADGVTLADVDGIDPPAVADNTPPDAGDTDPKLLAATGDIKARYGTGSHDGWVRVNGRTIGNASSGATERANDDTEALFEFLWAADANLTVSGGRGATATGDFTAGKTIQLPNAQNRSLVGLLMGGTDPGILDSSLVDNSKTNDTLGATLGASTHVLTVAEMPSHNHGGASGSAGVHSHVLSLPGRSGSSAFVNRGAAWGMDDNVPGTADATTSSAGAHTHTITSQGDGGAHPNMQPSILITWYLKL